MRITKNRLNEVNNSLFQGYSNESRDSQMISPDVRTSTPVSYDHHPSFAVKDISNIEIFHTDKHGKKCLSSAFIKAMDKYPEQCEKLLNTIYKTRRGPKPACIRKYLKPVVKPETKPRGWNLINFWDTERGLQRREVSLHKKIRKLRDELERIKTAPGNEKSRWYKEDILNERYEKIKTKLKKEQHTLEQIQRKGVAVPTIRRIRKSNSALKGTAKEYTIDGIPGYDVKSFLDEVRPQIINKLTKNRQVIVQFVLTCNMEKVELKTGEVITNPAHFWSNGETNIASTDVDNLYSKSKDKMMEAMSTYQSQGSNWRLKSVTKLVMKTITYKPLRGSSYIPLPPYLAKKKAIVNMKNEDNQCFWWCIASWQNSAKTHPEK